MNLKNINLKNLFPVRRKRINRSIQGDLSIFIILLIGGAFMGFPIIFSISNALKPANEIWLFPPNFIVRNPTFKNFTDLANILSNSLVPFSRYLFNTVFITVMGTSMHVLFASMCAYPLAKEKFRGKNMIFAVIVMALMFNAAVTMIPNFIIMSSIGWINTHLSLIVPAIGMPLGLYLMKQFMEGVPQTLIEAARIDGASEYRIFFRIIMPIIKPAWLTLIVLSVQGLWNTGPTVYIYKEELKPFAYALMQIVNAGIARAGVSSAATVIMLSVPITIFLLTQKNIIETMTASGIKE